MATQKGNGNRARLQDLTGQRFGRLAVQSFAGYVGKHGNAAWNCLCDCGRASVVRGFSLRSKKRPITSCRNCVSRATHGEAVPGNQSVEYRLWAGMKQRCTNPSAPGWHNYGGRGIKVCQRWADSFEAFLEDMGRRPGEGYSIDRYPNQDGDYEPGNCRWATWKEQNRNKRDNRILEFGGKRRCVNEWAEVVGLPVSTLKKRLKNGWSVEAILTAPRKPDNRLIEFNGQIRSLKAWAEETGIPSTTLRMRLKYGWSVEKTLTTPVGKKR
jgi:hypothetical protein